MTMPTSSCVEICLSTENIEQTSVISLIESHNIAIAAVDKLNNRLGSNASYNIVINCLDAAKLDLLSQALNTLPEVTRCNIIDPTFKVHIGGKIATDVPYPANDREDLSRLYTPGVARVCEKIHRDPKSAFDFTIRKNTVAVVTDGSAILGLGDLGPAAALPVMEGKALLLKKFANVDAFPICLDTQDVDEIVRIVTVMAPTFGAINLEDIAAPRCFEIEERLQKEIDIPVFHDDQHGTAVVTTAALINALKIVGKKAEDIKIVVNGTGAAGTACTRMFLELGVKHIVGCDRKGILSRGRDHLNDAKRAYVEMTNPNNEVGTLQDALKGADVFIGLSAPNAINTDDIQTMANDPIIFAMANPTPEIMPDIAGPYVAVMATGRSDFPNQINNLLAFPGIFRGALDCRTQEITRSMLMVAAKAIAHIVTDEELSAQYIIPSVFNEQVVPLVADAIMAHSTHYTTTEKQHETC